MGELTLRAARVTDVFDLAQLLADQEPRSRYADGPGRMVPKEARRLLAQMIQRHGGEHVGGTCVTVAEVDGRIVGFMAGVLSRIYDIGDRLVAQDAFLVVGDGAPPATSGRLIDAYTGWASAVPKVLEIMLSWTDALPTGPRMHKTYVRKGFEPCGRIYRRAVALGGDA